jgi:F-type H+-transporting ATPase subunit epsilon
MATPFHLTIATPDGSKFEGEATRLIARTIDGDTAIMAGHTNYCSALGMGEAKVVMENGKERLAACMGGMLSVMKGQVRLIATTFEWQDEIDLQRAEEAKRRAEQQLQSKNSLDDKSVMMAEAKLKRALIRSEVAQRSMKM